MYAAICLAHVAVPFLVRWYPSSSIIFLSCSMGVLVMSWVSSVPSNMALSFTVSLLSSLVVYIGGICIIKQIAPFSSTMAAAFLMFARIFLAFSPCLMSLVPTCIITVFPLSVSSFSCSAHALVSLDVIVVTLVML